MVLKNVLVPGQVVLDDLWKLLQDNHLARNPKAGRSRSRARANHSTMVHEVLHARPNLHRALHSRFLTSLANQTSLAILHHTMTDCHHPWAAPHRRCGRSLLVLVDSISVQASVLH